MGGAIANVDMGIGYRIMRAIVHLLIAALLVIVAVMVIGIVYVRSTGLRGQPEPGPIETRVARAMRGFAIPSERKAQTNPLEASKATITGGLEHFARYCSMCHANDGSGKKTPIGNGLYPKPPDLRAAATQDLTDGELFYIIENGVRFTGMPAFGTGQEDPAGAKQVWQLVHFIRHLPRIAKDEIEHMESLNPL
jgi:mono/diheme cytochrome c family protein